MFSSFSVIIANSILFFASIALVANCQFKTANARTRQPYRYIAIDQDQENIQSRSRGMRMGIKKPSSSISARERASPLTRQAERRRKETRGRMTRNTRSGKRLLPQQRRDNQLKEASRTFMWSQNNSHQAGKIEREELAGQRNSRAIAVITRPQGRKIVGRGIVRQFFIDDLVNIDPISDGGFNDAIEEDFEIVLDGTESEIIIDSATIPKPSDDNEMPEGSFSFTADFDEYLDEILADSGKEEIVATLIASPTPIATMVIPTIPIDEFIPLPCSVNATPTIVDASIATPTPADDANVIATLIASIGMIETPSPIQVNIPTIVTINDPSSIAVIATPASTPTLVVDVAAPIIATLIPTPDSNNNATLIPEIKK